MKTVIAVTGMIVIPVIFDKDLGADEAMTAEALVALAAEVEAGAFPVKGPRLPFRQTRMEGGKVEGPAIIRTILGLVQLPVLGRDHILVLDHRYRVLLGERTKLKKTVYL